MRWTRCEKPWRGRPGEGRNGIQHASMVRIHADQGLGDDDEVMNEVMSTPPALDSSQTTSTRSCLVPLEIPTYKWREVRCPLFVSSRTLPLKVRP